MEHLSTNEQTHSPEPMSQWVCECHHPDCNVRLQIPSAVAKEVDQHNWFVISDACRHGLAQHQKLVRKENGYSIYKDTNLNPETEGHISEAP